MAVENKICATCGRPIEWRKKWEKSWDQVKYCSERCRRDKSKTDFQDAILELLEIRGADKTICPSELLEPSQKTNKDMMERVRQSARLLAAKNQIEIIQGGKAVDPEKFKGPIRLRRKPKFKV